MANTFAGDPLSPKDEAQLQREQRAAYVTQLEAEIAAIEEKLSGWQQTLAAKRDELEAAQAEARESREG